MGISINVHHSGGIDVNMQGEINRGILSAYVNENGQLVLIMNDGQHVIIPGNVRGRGISGVFISGTNLMVTMDDGEVINAGAIPVGHTEEEKDIILELLRNAAYRVDMTNKINRLAVLFGREAVTVPEYRLTLRLTNINSTVTDGTILPSGSSFATELTASEGYTLDGSTVVVTMGGKQIDAFDGKMVSIAAVTGNVEISGHAVAVGEKTHTVTLRLEGFTADVAAETTINDGDPFSCALTPDPTHKLDGASVQVHMGGVDISDSAYSDGKISIPAVTDDVQVSATAVEKTKFRVSRILQGATIDNMADEVYEGSPYAARITMLSTHTAHEVSVSMGGVNITATAYSNGYIYIPAVTGGIIILVRATKVHRVTFTCDNCTASGLPNTVVDGERLHFVIQADREYTMDGAEVEVLMGGVDITASAYSDRAVSIEAVTGDVSVTAVARKKQAFKVTHSLTHATSSNTATEVLEGGSYTTNLIPDDGYTMDGAEVKVLMGGVDVTLTSYNNGVVVITKVTGDIEIVATAAMETRYDVFVNLTHCAASNNGGTVLAGATFSTLITPLVGYVLQSLTVTMGGIDITSLAVSGSMVQVKGVSGDIVVTAIAVKESDLVATVTVRTTNCMCTVTNGTRVNYGMSLNGAFSAGKNYSMHGATVTITVGGVDVTDDVYDNQAFTFTIPVVNGDVVIVATTNTSIS